MEYPIKKPKSSAREVIRTITKESDPVEVAAAVDAALYAQWQNARDYQEMKKRTFDLSFPEFLSLVTRSRRQRMENSMAKGQFERMMKGKYGYVLGWKSRKAFKTGIMSLATAEYLNRDDSERSTQFGPGDEHSDESKDLIRKARTGKKASDKTKAKMSAAKKGKQRDEDTKKSISNTLKGRPKTEVEKAKIRAGVIARLAEKKAALEEQQCLENTQKKPSERSQMPAEANVIPMKCDDVSVMRSEGKPYPQNIVLQLQRVSAIVGRKPVLTPFEAGLSAQA